MKLNILFGKDKIDWFATNSRYIESLKQELNNTDNRLISYTLNDLPLTIKFIEYWQIYRKYTADRLQSSYMKYNVNYYPMQSYEMLFSAKKSMNEIIDKLKKYEISVDNDLKLDIQSQDNEIKKLNKLHFIFEKEAINLKSRDPEKCQNYHDIWYSLEKINNLVHFLENFKNGSQKRMKNFHMAIRPGRTISENGFQYYDLQDEDYRDFTMPTGGDLICDYATVGKDLFACSCTDDIELVKRNEVKQQSQLTDFIFLNFDSQEKTSNFRNHYAWCEQNDVEKYYDYKQPKYNPGRHVFGKIDEPIYTGKDFYDKILSKTPAFLGYYLSDDRGEPLVPEGM